MIRDQIIELYNGQDLLSSGDNNFDLWLNIYRGESYWIGGDNMKSLNLGAAIPNELARPATIEFKTKTDNDRLNEDYFKLISDVRKITEYGLALGGIILKPYPVGDRVTVDVVTPDMFIPLDVDNFGEISRIVFLDRIKRIEDETYYYTRVEEHDRDGDLYVIRNRCFKSKNKDDLGTEVELSSVDIWEDIDNVAVMSIEHNLYGYFKNPQANNLDLKSPLGISCFAKAVSLMQDADEQYNRFLWEYESKETAIDADITLFMGKNVDTLPVGKERLFRKLNAHEEFYEVFSPDIRDESLIKGLNEILKKVEDLCQLHRGSLSEVEVTERTATEIVASRQRLYAAVVDIQKSLEKCLRDTVQAMAFWLDISDYEISFDWDDSVVVDSEKEQAIRLQEVAAGLIKPEDYLMWRYGLTEEQAREKLPDVEIPEDDIKNAYRDMGGRE